MGGVLLILGKRRLASAPKQHIDRKAEKAHGH